MFGEVLQSKENARREAFCEAALEARLVLADLDHEGILSLYHLVKQDCMLNTDGSRAFPFGSDS